MKLTFIMPEKANEEGAWRIFSDRVMYSLVNDPLPEDYEGTITFFTPEEAKAQAEENAFIQNPFAYWADDEGFGVHYFITPEGDLRDSENDDMGG